MPSFLLESRGSDLILRNKYGIYSKLELEQQLHEGSINIGELGRIYDLKKYQILHIIRTLGISYRNTVNDTRVLDSRINEDMHQVLIGTLLGDASMVGSSYRLAHSLNQMDYFYDVAEYISSFVSNISFREHKHGNAVELRTHCHPVLERYFKIFYPNNSKKKYITREAAQEIGPKALAYWYMDDGKYDEYGFYLCVGIISDVEGQYLISALKEKFGLEATFQNHDTKKGYHNIYILSKSRDKFISLISDHIISSMRYKLSSGECPKLSDKSLIADRHVAFCKRAQRLVPFSGNKGIQSKIAENLFIKDAKDQYIEAIRTRIKEGKQISHTSIRKMPSDDALKGMFDFGMTDQQIAEKYGFGRNTISKKRKELGIDRKARRVVEHRIKFPCLDTKLVSAKDVISNEYNPNKVARPEMDLLIHSIEEDGLTQPVVVFYDKDLKKYIVIDGFHRYTVLKEHFKCTEIPVVVLKKNINDRMASTIRHNRARGKHQVDLMGVLVKKLSNLGWSDKNIADHLGMQGEELFRLRQQIGCAEVLSANEYSKSWEVV